MCLFNRIWIQLSSLLHGRETVSDLWGAKTLRSTVWLVDGQVINCCPVVKHKVCRQTCCFRGFFGLHSSLWHKSLSNLIFLSTFSTTIPFFAYSWCCLASVTRWWWPSKRRTRWPSSISSSKTMMSPQVTPLLFTHRTMSTTTSSMLWSR